eukprot:SAG31_NODE_3023_length_4780_cov_5.085665_1_plen_87_part_10
MSTSSTAEIVDGIVNRLTTVGLEITRTYLRQAGEYLALHGHTAIPMKLATHAWNDSELKMQLHAWRQYVGTKFPSLVKGAGKLDLVV